MVGVCGNSREAQILQICAFSKTIIQLALVGYKIVIANEALL